MISPIVANSYSVQPEFIRWNVSLRSVQTAVLVKSSWGSFMVAKGRSLQTAQLTAQRTSWTFVAQTQTELFQSVRVNSPRLTHARYHDDQPKTDPVPF